MDEFKNFVDYLIKYFFVLLGYDLEETTIEIIVGLILAIFSMVFFLYRLNRKRLHRYSVIEYFSKSFVKETLSLFVPTSLNQTFIADQEVDYEVFTNKDNIDAIRHFKQIINNDEPPNRFFLVLGDIGSGKTTFLINLFHRVNSVFNKYKPYFVPLSDFDALDKINAIQDKKKVVLLLDGLDENRKLCENYQANITHFMKIISAFKSVIVTCRVQFFLSEKKELQRTSIKKYDKEKGVHIFNKVYITPFDNNEVETYLKKKFPYRFLSRKNSKKYSLALDLVRSAPSLMSRPLLLSYIDDLINLDFNKIKNTAQIYSYMINCWLMREAEQSSNPKSKFKSLYIFSITLAMYIFRNSDNVDGNRVSPTMAEKIASSLKIDLDRLDITNRSLLNRDSKGRYGFSHKSITEYLIALFYFHKSRYFEVSAHEKNIHRFMFDLAINYGMRLADHRPINSYSLLDIDRSNVGHYYSKKLSALPKLKLGYTFYKAKEVIEHVRDIPAFPIRLMDEISAWSITRDDILDNFSKNPYKRVGDFFKEKYGEDIENHFYFAPDYIKLGDVISNYCPYNGGLLVLVDEYGQASGVFEMSIALELFRDKFGIPSVPNEYVNCVEI